MLDETAQLRHAQENLTKTIDAEIRRRVDRDCQAWRMKVARLLRERETIRDHIELGHPDLALALLRQNDSEWFKGVSARQYAVMLENS